MDATNLELVPEIKLIIPVFSRLSIRVFTNQSIYLIVIQLYSLYYTIVYIDL